MAYRSQYRPIGIGNIVIELTRRVNDSETVYIARNTKVVVTVVDFNGEKKLRSRLKYSDVLHGSILLSPFFVPSYVLLLGLSNIIFGVVPFSLVAALVSTSQL